MPEPVASGLSLSDGPSRMRNARFQGHVAWITGASSGIGRHLALELARQGADVAVSARRVDRLEGLVAELEGLGRRGLAVPCDVTDEAGVEKAVLEVVEKLGRLDIAVANAGFGVMGAVERLHAEDWRRQFDTNVVGAAMTARYALPELRKTRGRFVLVGSAAALISSPGSAAYSASKAAVRVLGQVIQMELHGSGVSCTTIHPGYVESEIALVDNRGQLKPHGKDRRPEALLWPTDRAAKVMVGALARRKGDFVFTGHGRLGAFLGQHFPSFVVWLVGRLSARRKAPIPSKD